MNYKLLKEFPWYPIWYEFEDWTYPIFDAFNKKAYPDFFEPIVEIKSVHDLKVWDTAFWIWYNGNIKEYISDWCESRSETFLTREEAEDEHNRREWAVRKNKFFPKEWELYYTQWRDTGDIEKFKMTNDYIDNFIINSWLAFRTCEECQDAIDNHDIIRLFYTVR